MDILVLIATSRDYLTKQAYGAEERTTLLQAVAQLEQFHVALNTIADLGCCGGTGKFQDSLDLAVGAITRTAIVQ